MSAAEVADGADIVSQPLPGAAEARDPEAGSEHDEQARCGADGDAATGVPPSPLCSPPPGRDRDRRAIGGGALARAMSRLVVGGRTLVVRETARDGWPRPASAPAMP